MIFSSYQIKIIVNLFSFLFLPLGFYLPVALPIFSIFLALFFLTMPGTLSSVTTHLYLLKHKILLFCIPLSYLIFRPLWGTYDCNFRFGLELIGLLSLLWILFWGGKNLLDNRKEALKQAPYYLIFGGCVSLVFTFIDYATYFGFTHIFTSKYCSLSKFHKGLMFSVALFLMHYPLRNTLLMKLIWGIGGVILFYLTLFYDSDAIILGIFTGGIAAFILPYIAYAPFIFCGAFWVYTLAMPFLVEFVLTPDLLSTYIPKASYTWYHRLHSWKFFVQKIFEKPIVGWGVDITKHDTFRKMIGWNLTPHQMLYMKSSKNIHSSWFSTEVSTYPHNFAIQIWLEFGIMGVVSLGFMIIMMGLYLQKKPRERALPYLVLCIFVCTILSAGFNPWQKWLLSGISLLLVFYNIHVKAERNSLHTS